jgi:cystathionine beta-lyase/cystathionine gamma-synthase
MFGIPVADFDANNKEDRYVRLYIGLEDANYLIKDLQQAFDKYGLIF